MTDTGIPVLVSCGQTRSQECARSCSQGAQGAVVTWGGRRGPDRVCCRRGRLILDFYSKEKSKQGRKNIRAVTMSSRFWQGQLACLLVLLPAVSVQCAVCSSSATVAVWQLATRCMLTPGHHTAAQAYIREEYQSSEREKLISQG